MSNGNQGNRDRWWDVLSKLTPLLIGLFVTGLGTVATMTYQAKELQLAQIQTLNEFRPLLQSDDSVERAFAYEAFGALGYKQLAVSLIRAAMDPAGRPALAAMAATEGPTQQAAREALAEVPVNVFLHIAAEAQRSQAAEIQAAIQQDLSYIVPGIENVAEKAPSQLSVRYFHEIDADAAKSVAGLLAKHGFPDATPTLVRLRAKPGTVEVWFPPPASQ